ncbi:MAG: hypothetical protein ACRC3H_24645 [Lachnospiraceae bacterium]
MIEKQNHLYVDSHERSLLLHNLVELIFKVTTARTKKIKIEYS